jgi:NAD(P)-dependent dehydrogenase (short-subunit alcohol dehydrogenase family)
MRVQGKVALVAGAGMMGPPGGKLGNGRAAALLLAKEGASVVAADQSLEAAEATVAMIKENGGEAVALQGDDEQWRRHHYQHINYLGTTAQPRLSRL